jgi:hypothetical protein
MTDAQELRHAVLREPNERRLLESHRRLLRPVRAHGERKQEKRMNRLLPATLVATVVVVTMVSAAPKFTSAWRSSDAGSVSFAGKKLAALVISQDEALRMSGEEALVRELTARGLEAVATYRIAPKEELQSAERARVWFEKANVEGVVGMRPVSKEKRTTYTSTTWTNPYYSTFWGYYGYGWSSPGWVQQDTVVVVETTIYSIPRNQLLWAAVSETKDPKTLQRFVQDLVKESVKELHNQGLARRISK